eukprot:m.78747 g.78747  ORF g.78747 m.78747 type:complete len:217 (+) comp11967_c2_seq2:283-933(+)
MSSSNAASTTDEGVPLIAIIGLAAGMGVIVIVLIIALCCVIKKGKKTRTQTHPTDNAVERERLNSMLTGRTDTVGVVMNPIFKNNPMGKNESEDSDVESLPDKRTSLSLNSKRQMVLDGTQTESGENAQVIHLEEEEQVGNETKTESDIHKLLQMDTSEAVDVDEVYDLGEEEVLGFDELNDADGMCVYVCMLVLIICFRLFSLFLLQQKLLLKCC